MEEQNKIIKEYYKNDEDINKIIYKFNNIIINFSGGKDSIATLIKMNEEIKDKNIKFIIRNIYNFLEYDIKNYIEYIIKLILKDRKYEFEYITFTEEQIENKKNKIIEQSKKYGVPIYIRYCQQIIKYNLLSKQNKNEINIVCNGVRRKESINRNKYVKINIHKRDIEYRPVIDYTEKEVYNIIEKNNIPLYYLYIYR